MSEYSFEALECRPEDLRYALPIHTQKITDSCRDKDCIEDLRVYLTTGSQAILDTASGAKVRCAEHHPADQVGRSPTKIEGPAPVYLRHCEAVRPWQSPLPQLDTPPGILTSKIQDIRC